MIRCLHAHLLLWPSYHSFSKNLTGFSFKLLAIQIRGWGQRKSWLKAQHSENGDHGIWSHHFMGNRWGNSVRLYLWGLQNHCRWWLQPSCGQLGQHTKKQRHYFANKGASSQSYSFSSSHVWIWQLDSKESWAPKNWCFWTVVLEKTLESIMDIQQGDPTSPS